MKSHAYFCFFWIHYYATIFIFLFLDLCADFCSLSAVPKWLTTYLKHGRNKSHKNANVKTVPPPKKPKS